MATIWKWAKPFIVSFAERSRLRKDAFAHSIALFAFIESILSLVGISMKDISPQSTFVVRALEMIIFIAVLFIVVYSFMYWRSSKGLRLTIAGNSVEIAFGDIFEEPDWKVIPCDATFETRVDDVVIAHTTLHGQLIDKYVEDAMGFEEAIRAASAYAVGSVPETGRLKFDLGRVIPYENEYLLLASTELDSDYKAYITPSDYEQCLMNMWEDLSRTYAGRPINLPLIGGGIARFKGGSGKTPDGLLRCILCTLRTTGETFCAPIRIVLQKNLAHELRLYELKDLSDKG